MKRSTTLHERRGHLGPTVLFAVLSLGLGACGDSSDSSDSAGTGGPPRASGSGATSTDDAPAEDSGGRDRRSGRSGRRDDTVEVRALDDPATAGVVRGLVRFEGEPPKRTPMSGIAKTAGCLAEGLETPLSESVIVNDGALENVFVWVKKGLPRDYTAPQPEGELLLDQHGCTYSPRVLGIQVGQTLRVRNSDPITHNVNCQAQRNDRFNRTQAPSGKAEEWTPAKQEVMTTFGCNIHPWMFAYVGVVEHPFFAVTGPDGRFALEGLPPGEYEVEAWHEKYGRHRGAARVSAEGGAEMTFVFP